MKVLLIEDDEVTADLITEWFQAQRYTVESCHNGEDGLEMALLHPFDLIVVDWGLPGLSGIDLVRRLRVAGSAVPVLMLTGKHEISEKEEGLDSGADDYLTKPFDMRELSARVRALSRRGSSIKDNIVRTGDIELNRDSATVKLRGEPVKLMPTEYALLEFFMTHPNRIFSLDSLLCHVWKSSSEATDSSVRSYVTRLRKKLGEDLPIHTVHGMGYRFDM